MCLRGVHVMMPDLDFQMNCPNIMTIGNCSYVRPWQWPLWLLYFVFKILSAGSEPNLFHWQLNGDPKAQVPCTPNSVFTIQVNSKSPKNKVTCSRDNVFRANCQSWYSGNTASPFLSQFSLLSALEHEAWSWFTGNLM